MGVEFQVSRYVVEERTFIVRDLDMERVAQKKVEQRARKLPAMQQEVFRRLTDVLGSVIVWDRLDRHVMEALTSASPKKKAGNIYLLQEDINTILNRIEKWVRRNRDFSDEKVREFAVNIYRSSKSICRMFDQNATCWKKGAEEAVAANV
jgi:hypothetical protein